MKLTRAEEMALLRSQIATAKRQHQSVAKLEIKLQALVHADLREFNRGWKAEARAAKRSSRA